MLAGTFGGGLGFHRYGSGPGRQPPKLGKPPKPAAASEPKAKSAAAAGGAGARLISPWRPSSSRRVARRLAKARPPTTTPVGL